MTVLPTFADIEAAARRIAAFAVKTPLIENAALNARLGGRILFKLETLQRTGSFKFRGACNCIALIANCSKGVVAFSSGNHAQGVAAAAALFEIPATIVMPKDAPRAKIEGTRALGATIIFYDRHSDDREAIAARLCVESGATLIRPFDDAGVVAGQGTVGLEIAAAMEGETLDAVLVPCGGGGLTGGIALALSHLSPGTSVISVEPENYDGMRRSMAVGRRVAAPGGMVSIADALMAPMPGEIPFALAKQHSVAGLAISDADLDRAVGFAAHHLKLMVEPGGSAALAAVLAKKINAQGKTLVIVMSGANCDLETLVQCVAREAPT